MEIKVYKKCDKSCALCDKFCEFFCYTSRKFFCFTIFYINCYISAVEVRNWTPEYYIANQSDCQQILEGSDALTEIPLLNNAQLHDVRDKELVRFRGMIQDMYNPEYYFKQYEVKNTDTGESNVRCGMYMDTARCLVNYLLSIFLTYIELFYVAP